MTHIDKILEKALFSNESRQPNSEELNKLYDNATKKQKQLIDQVLTLLGSDKLPEIRKYF